jgi:predicted O-methyltransferase YrrM
MKKPEQVSKWYEDNYKNKSGFRFETFKLALTTLYEINDNPVIFETGTLRLENDYGAGYSTYIFGECISLFGGKLFTIDIDPINIKTSKRVTEPFSKNITYIIEDSLTAILKFENSIDLLYLDSLDCPIEGDASVAQKHNLNEFLLAECKLHEKSLVLIDDVNFQNGGKAKLTHEYLQFKDYELIFSLQQSLWRKK